MKRFKDVRKSDMKIHVISLFRLIILILRKVTNVSVTHFFHTKCSALDYKPNTRIFSMRTELLCLV